MPGCCVNLAEKMPREKCVFPYKRYPLPNCVADVVQTAYTAIYAAVVLLKIRQAFHAPKYGVGGRERAETFSPSYIYILLRRGLYEMSSNTNIDGDHGE